jgi:NADH dehydrogenase
MQQGKYAAKPIVRRLKGQDGLPPFHYRDKGSMATVSRFHAVTSVGSRIRLAGFIAWLMWLAVHIVYLIGFKNRVTTLMHWAVTFIGRGRSERVATEQQVFARMALAREKAAVEAEAAAGPNDPENSPENTQADDHAVKAGSTSPAA